MNDANSNIIYTDIVTNLLDLLINTNLRSMFKQLLDDLSLFETSDNS